MSQALKIIDDDDLVYIRDGGVYANSLGVAKKYRKDHKNVVARIKQVIEKATELGNELNFKLIDYVDTKGRVRVAYEMDREAFASVTLGFTGDLALEFRIRYVARFHEMERELAATKEPAPTALIASQAMSIDMRNPEHLALAFPQVIEMAKEAEARAADEAAQKQIAIGIIDEMAPRVAFAEEVEASGELMTMKQAARVCGIRERDFFDFIKNTKRMVFYEGGVLVPRAQFVADGLFRVKYPNANGKVRPQTHVTGKGISVIKAAWSARRQDLLSRLRLDRLPAGVSRQPRPAITKTIN